MAVVGEISAVVDLAVAIEVVEADLAIEAVEEVLVVAAVDSTEAEAISAVVLNGHKRDSVEAKMVPTINESNSTKRSTAQWHQLEFLFSLYRLPPLSCFVEDF